MRWHALWRTKIESTDTTVAIIATEHDGQQHKIVLQREDVDELLRTRAPDHATDGGRMVAWLREGADELEKAHLILDLAAVPRSLPGADVECTLAARIQLLADRAADAEQEVYDQGERS